MEETKKKINYLKIFMQICIAITLITISYGLIINYNVGELKDEYGERGTFGDMYGALNSLFSGFAFAGVIITILMQMRELKLTRDELSKTARAQDESQKALNKQLETMQITTKMDVLNSYIDIMAKDKNSLASEIPPNKDKITIAEMLIRYNAEQLFNSNEYTEIIKPIWNYSGKCQRPLKGFSNVFKFELLNNGSGCEILSISAVDFLEVKNNDSTTKLEPGSIILNRERIYCRVRPNIEGNFNLTFRGLTIKNIWKQQIKINSYNDSLDVQLDIPQLVGLAKV